MRARNVFGWVVVALASACGGEDGLPGPADGKEVELRNFMDRPLSVVRDGEAAGSSNLLQPMAKRNVLVDATLGATTRFEAFENGTSIASGTCTVTEAAWRSVPPKVTLQFGALECLDW